MRFVSYNILTGGLSPDRTDLLLSVLKRLEPTYLAVQEANYFEDDDNARLKLFSKELNLPYCALGRGGEKGKFGFYNCATFSKYPFVKSETLPGFRNAAVHTVIETKVGMVSIVNTHLIPRTDELKLKELSVILAAQEQYDNRVVLGDLNGIAKYDNYPASLVRNLDGHEKQKLSLNEELQFKIPQKLLEMNYADVLFELGANENTVPALFGEKEWHRNKLRLDYCFVSKNLLPNIVDAKVVKNKDTKTASDHYPLVIDFDI